MHPWTTNIVPQTFDVHHVGFESTGVLGFTNEYSGLAVSPATYIAFAELKSAFPYSEYNTAGG
jgi:hypothetical protein